MKRAIATLLITALGLALLVYSAMRGLDFISATLPPDKQIMAYFALAATEGGLVFWLLYYLFAANGSWQRGISIVMLVIDFLGSTALFTADTLLRSGEAGIITAMTPDEIQTIILGMSGLIALNVAATLACHIFDPEAQKAAAEQEARDAIDDATIKRIQKDADELAAELAPIRAEAWINQTRRKYKHELASGPIIDAVALPAPAQRTTQPSGQPGAHPANLIQNLAAMLAPKPTQPSAQGRTYAAEAATQATGQPGPQTLEMDTSGVNCKELAAAILAAVEAQKQAEAAPLAPQPGSNGSKPQGL